MPVQNEWLFDLLWELSDTSYAAGLPELAGKLEEAMDTFLAEYQLNRPRSQAAQIASRRRSNGRDLAQARLSAIQERRMSAPTPGPARLRQEPEAIANLRKRVSEVAANRPAEKTYRWNCGSLQPT